MNKLFLSALVAGSLVTLDTIVHAEEYSATAPVYIGSEQDTKSKDTAENNDNNAIRNDYNSLLAQIKQKQQQLLQQYVPAEKNKKQIIMAESKKYLLSAIIDEIIPAWQQTPWEFYGKTNMPKEGNIACGMFISTILQHAGFNLPRLALGELHAGNIILNLNDNVKDINFYHGDAGINQLINDVQKQEEGLYVIGLDNHIGFITYHQDELLFSHSSNIAGIVVSEPVAESEALKLSQYRVVGKIITNKTIEQWLGGREISLRYTTIADYKEAITGSR